MGVIFEVMNNRGKPLSELEKVKNYLLYVASKLNVENHRLADEINAAWAEVFQRLMAAGLTTADFEDRLLRAHWLTAYDPARKGWAGSKSVKSKFDLRVNHRKHKVLLRQISDYVRSLMDSVLVFAEIFTPQLGNTFSAYPDNRRLEIRSWATKLTRTGALSTFLPILMATRLRSPTNVDSYLEALRLCELYAFRVYRWGSRRADAGQTRLFRLGFDLFHRNTTLAEISREMRAMTLAYCPDRAFEEGFEAADDNNFYAWPGLRYFLYEYEEHLAKGRGVKMTWEDLQTTDPEKTIEHVLPQTATEKYWTKRFDHTERKRLGHHIGNLTLTFDNSAYSNKAFPEKRGELKTEGACYTNSSIFMERRIARDFEDWTPEAVLKRGRQIKQWALERWKVDDADLPEDSAELLEAEEESE